MVRWLLVLGCYGFVVWPAAAREPWSEDTCQHLREIKAHINANKEFGTWVRAVMVVPIMESQAEHCELPSDSEFEAAEKIVKAGSH